MRLRLSLAILVSDGRPILRLLLRRIVPPCKSGTSGTDQRGILRGVRLNHIRLQIGPLRATLRHTLDGWPGYSRVGNASSHPSPV